MSNRSQNIDSIKIRLVAPAAVAAASGLLSPAAWSAPGDLDPSFGDVGRSMYRALNGDVSAVVADGDGVFIGGGVDYTVSYYGTYEFDGFVELLGGDGIRDDRFQPLYRGSSDIVDLARMPDGKVVAVGTTSDPVGQTGLLVVRQNADGTLDTGFGNGGSVVLPDIGGIRQWPHAVILDPDGRITVAAQRGSYPILIRLTASGALDLTFATAGVYEDARQRSIGPIVRAQAGGYRFAVYEPQTGCQLIALTAAGAIDPSFGVQGIASNLAAPAGNAACQALAVDESGRLLAAGTSFPDTGPQSYMTRLEASGAIDPSFDASAAMGEFESVRALAVSGDAIFLAGEDVAAAPGQLIMRLDSSGAIDAAFGDQGRTWFDVPSSPNGFLTQAAVRDLDVLPDRTLIAGGGTGRRAVVARYFGDAGGDSPGIVGIVSPYPESSVEASGTARVLVRRVGGRSGIVSVAYSAEESSNFGTSATPGTDFPAVSGRLEWADGDAAPKEIVIPLVADAGETTEYFEVKLSDPVGAGLGWDVALPSIRSDGFPGGLMAVAGGAAISEGRDYGITVIRGDYVTGRVSVTVNVAAGTATEGADYRFTPVTLTWADGDGGAKLVTIQTVEDQTPEGAETFTVTLANPTGGAALAAANSMVVTIRDEDAATGGGGGGGGGGSAGWLLAGLFGLLGAFRRPGVR